MKTIASLTFIALLIAYGGIFLFQKAHAEDKDKRLQKLIQQEKIVDEDSRQTLRAFYTAPPTIPHAIDNQNSKNCLDCHQQVTRLPDLRVAKQTPHPHLSNCLQCHVRQIGDKNKTKDTDFKGLEEPIRGTRFSPISPPTIPHRLFMRENCLSCHGADSPDLRLRTPHPERTSCLQCHGINKQLEFLTELEK